MSTIAIDGLNEETFRRSIESRLRQGKSAEAVERLRTLLAPYAGEGGPLPARFLTVQASDLSLYGWEGLGDALARHDRPNSPVTAISVAFGWPGEELPQPDADGRLSPLIETGFFTDEAFPFSQSAREDLLDGYSYHGCTWADQGEMSDRVLSLGGIDDLHGALALLEARLLASEEPDEEEIRAGSLGACLLSALLVQTVADRIARDGLPRPLCVLAGSNNVYPYFDAPVVGMPADQLRANEDEVPEGQGVPGPRYSSLLVTGIPRARKRAVLVLDESEAERAVRNASLRDSSPQPDSRIAALGGTPAEPPRPQPLEGITPVPNGPLMTKKPHKPAWDFRDMLGSGGEDAVPSELALRAPPPPPKPDPWAEPQAAPNEPRPDRPDELEALAVEPDEGRSAPRLPRLTLAPVAEPGFDLIEPGIQERLQALVAPRIAIEPAGEPADAPPPEAPARAEAETLAEPMPPPPLPVWPLGIGWLEESEPAPAESAPAPEPEPARWWTRLRRWILRR